MAHHPWTSHAPCPRHRWDAARLARTTTGESLPRGFLTIHDDFDPAFREMMRQLGYLEGQNLVLEGRFAQGQAERLPALAAELVQLGVDVLVTISTPAALAAKDATTRIPIVMASVSQPVERGLVASLAQPGGNLTGQSNEPGTELGGKQLEILKEAVPTLSRVGVFWNATFQTPTLRAIEAAAQALGITVLPVDIQKPADIDAAFATMLQERAEALVVTAAAQNVRHYQQIADFAPRTGSRPCFRRGGRWRPAG